MSVELNLTNAHRRALGSRLAGLAELLRMSRLEGFDRPGIEPLLEDIAQIEADTGAVPPLPAPRPVHGLLSRAVVLAEDIAPRGLKQYGELSEQTAAYLTETSSRLEQAVFALLDELERDETVDNPGSERTP